MKPVHSALIFAVVLFLTNIGIDQATGGESRPLASLLAGAIVGGLVFGLVLHWYGRRRSSA